MLPLPSHPAALLLKRASAACTLIHACPIDPPAVQTETITSLDAKVCGSVPRLSPGLVLASLQIGIWQAGVHPARSRFSWRAWLRGHAGNDEPARLLAAYRATRQKRTHNVSSLCVIAQARQAV